MITIRDQVLSVLRKKKEVAYPELLMDTMARPEEVREVLRRLKEENKIRCEEESSQSLYPLPKEVKFPDSLKDKIRYDAYRRLLIFKGKMSEKENDELRSLSSDEDYKKAISLLCLKSQIEVYRWVRGFLETFALE